MSSKSVAVSIYEHPIPSVNATLHTLPNFVHSDRYRQSQRQQGSADCGLFALAFAAVLASSRHPSAFLFDQQAMRGHLHKCLTTSQLSPFPTRTTGRENRKLTRMCLTIPVYCSCRMPQHFGDRMIACTQCHKWYHLGLCVSASDKQTKSQWFCGTCSH